MRHSFSLSSFAVLGLIVIGSGSALADEQQVWARTDGQSINSSDRLYQQFQIDMTVCKGVTQQTAAGMAPIYWHGLIGAIGASVAENQRQGALVDVAKGCMAQKGYLMMLASQAQEMIASRKPKKGRHQEVAD